MSQIKIFDTTLRDGEQSPGCSMNLKEKIEVARCLERLKVDVIEAGFAIASPGDFESVQTIARTVKDCSVASLARATVKDIACAWEAVKDAADPRIHLFIATSPLHMEYKLKMTPEQVLERTAAMVAHAKKQFGIKSNCACSFGVKAHCFVIFEQSCQRDYIFLCFNEFIYILHIF